MIAGAVASTKPFTVDSEDAMQGSGTGAPEADDSYRADLRAAASAGGRGRGLAAAGEDGAADGGWADLDGAYDAIEGAAAGDDEAALDDGVGERGNFGGGAGEAEEAVADLDVAFEDDAGDVGDVGDGVGVADAQGLLGVDARDVEEGEAALGRTGDEWAAVTGSGAGADDDPLAVDAAGDEEGAAGGDLPRHLLDQAHRLTSGAAAAQHPPAAAGAEDEAADGSTSRPTKRLRLDALDPLAALRDEVSTVARAWLPSSTASEGSVVHPTPRAGACAVCWTRWACNDEVHQRPVQVAVERRRRCFQDAAPGGSEGPDLESQCRGWQSRVRPEVSASGLEPTAAETVGVVREVESCEVNRSSSTHKRTKEMQ